ncbi:MAG: hypothetical protein GY754_30530 [bacterium]|nr:hypothetical protein [bacterium]
MVQKYTRPLSRSERLWIAADRLSPPFANQAVLEAFDNTGSFEIDRWQTAVEEASRANPGSRVVLKGVPGFRRWVDSGVTPPVREVNGSTWSGRDPENAPFLREELPAQRGPCCEVLLVRGNPLRVVFRSHHGIMDGRGTMLWMDDIFRVLRGEAPAGSSSRITDVILANSFQDETRKTFPREHSAPTGGAGDTREPGSVWKRLTLPGKYSNILGQAVCALAGETRSRAEGVVRFGIPVDLRHRREDLRSTANLSIAIYVEVPTGATPGEISEDIAMQLEQRRDGVLTGSGGLLKFLPLWLIRKGAQRVISAQHRQGLYGLTGIISNVGKLPVHRYRGGGFEACCGFFIPPSIESIPFFMSLTGSPQGVELVATVPATLASEGRLDAVLEGIVSKLVP